MGDAVEQGGGHFRIAEHGYPFAEGEVGRDDQRGLFIELADQVKQQRTSRCREGQIAQLIKNHGIEQHQLKLPLEMGVLSFVQNVDKELRNGGKASTCGIHAGI